MGILEKSDKEPEENSIQNEIDSRFGATFVVIVIIIIITTVAMTGVYFDYW